MSPTPPLPRPPGDREGEALAVYRCQCPRFSDALPFIRSLLTGRRCGRCGGIIPAAP